MDWNRIGGKMLDRRIKILRNIMRNDQGVSGNLQRIETIAWMLLLKVWDAREEDLEITEDGFASPLVNIEWSSAEGIQKASDLRWRTWAANPEGITGTELISFVDNELFPAMKNAIIPPISADDAAMRRRARIIMLKQCFGDFYSYMKEGIVMRQLINSIQSDIDYTQIEVRHIFGGMYESFLNLLQAAKDSGEFYTPRGVTEFVTEMVNPRLGEKVLDPACGTGGFLTATLRHVRAADVKTAAHEVELQSSILGIEKKPLPTVLCITNMIHHQLDDTTAIRTDNSLGRPIASYTEDDEVDIILTNPPFGGSELDGILVNFPSQYRTKETADLFMTLIHTRLRHGGRAAVVYPASPVGDGIKQRIVKRLVEECNLHTILQLPPSTFAPYASIGTNVLFFTKGEPTIETWFYQHQLPEGYKAYSKTKPIQLSEFEAEREWWNNREESEQAWRVPLTEIVEAGYAIFDWKNPNAPEDEVEAASVLLARYETQTAEVNALLDQLIVTLESSLFRDDE